MYSQKSKRKGNPMMDRQQNVPAVRVNDSSSDSAHAAWISGRIETLLSHYFQPDNPAEVMEAALDDWVDALSPFSRIAIEQACAKYLRDQPRRRPTPGDIRSKVREPSNQEAMKRQRGNKSDLTFDELDLLENKILPRARSWLTIPSLADHGKHTLEYWGETV